MAPLVLVLSELTRARPAPKVLAWLDSCDPEELATTAVTVAELLVGVALVPEGRRRAELEASVLQILSEELAIAPFDDAAARANAQPAAELRRAGRQVAFADGQIAGICRSLGATLATRNVEGFERFGVEIVDPWQQART